MKRSLAVGLLMIAVIVSSSAQEIIIDSITRNGTMSFGGALPGTTARVEWASSIGAPGGTTWHSFSNLLTGTGATATDVPMYLRVRGIPGPFSRLVAHYPFSGSPNDASGRGNHGVPSDAILCSDRNDNPNSAYEFDGVSSFISVPGVPSLDLGGASGFALAVWINPRTLISNDINSVQTILAQMNTHPAMQLNVNITGIQAQFSREPGDGAPNYWWRNHVLPVGETNLYDYTLSTGVWQHIVVTYDDNLISLYKDAQLVGTIDAIDDLDPQYTTNPLTIGKVIQFFSQHFDGKIDDVRIYNRPLSSNEVIQIYGQP